MKFYGIILLCFILTTSALGESINIKGKLLDSQTGEFVSFANIAIIELQNGTTSYQNGEFSLLIEGSDISNSLNISCINYKDTVIALKDLDFENLNLIKLEPLVYGISEIIVIPPKLEDEIIINKLKRSKILGGIACNNIPNIYARYFPNRADYENINTISSIQIGTKSWQNKGKSKIKIRIFKMDTVLNQPSSDILKEELIVILKNGKINTINLLKYNIRVPKEGVFVGIEWLIIPENKFEFISYDELKKKIKKINYGPTLGANYSNVSNTWEYWAGKWEKFIQPVPTIIRKNKVYDAAISITLSD